MPLLFVSSDTQRRISALLYYSVIVLFLAAVALSIAYQTSYVVNTNPHIPFLEPDNYEYYLFAQLAVAHPALTPANITNPYLINSPVGFFEHPGLYLIPVYFSSILPIPMIWVFRILQGLAVIVIYLFSLLIVKKVLDALPVSKIYHWMAYTIVITSFLIMQYTEITEWRGNEFMTAISLVIVYLMAWLYTKGYQPHRVWLVWLPVTALTLLAIWIWSAGGAVIVPLVTVLFFSFMLYNLFLHKHSNVWRYVAMAVVALSILLFFFPAPIENSISSITALGGFDGCLGSNLLNIGELQCLNASNGLIAVLMMMVFGSFALAAFLGNTIMNTKRKEYEYYLFGVFMAAILFLPLALIFIRMVGLVAPYLTILYALGIVAMLSYFSKSGSNRIVLSLTIILILLSSFVGQYIFYISSMTLYNFANPPGLVNATMYMNSSVPDGTVLTYYGYGGYLEAFGHLRVYADTVQGLNYTKIIQIDRVFTSNSSVACQLIKSFVPKPDFIMLSENMLNSTAFVNVSNYSILKEPSTFSDACGYGLEYDEGGFFVYAHINK
jgi:hypothetical protein